MGSSMVNESAADLAIQNMASRRLQMRRFPDWHNMPISELRNNNPFSSLEMGQYMTVRAAIAMQMRCGTSLKRLVFAGWILQAMT